MQGSHAGSLYVISRIPAKINISPIKTVQNVNLSDMKTSQEGEVRDMGKRY